MIISRLSILHKSVSTHPIPSKQIINLPKTQDRLTLAKRVRFSGPFLALFHFDLQKAVSQGDKTALESMSKLMDANPKLLKEDTTSTFNIINEAYNQEKHGNNPEEVLRILKEKGFKIPSGRTLGDHRDTDMSESDDKGLKEEVNSEPQPGEASSSKSLFPSILHTVQNVTSTISKGRRDKRQDPPKEGIGLVTYKDKQYQVIKTFEEGLQHGLETITALKKEQNDELAKLELEGGQSKSSDQEDDLYKRRLNNLALARKTILPAAKRALKETEDLDFYLDFQKSYTDQSPSIREKKQLEEAERGKLSSERHSSQWHDVIDPLNHPATSNTYHLYGHALHSLRDLTDDRIPSSKEDFSRPKTPTQFLKPNSPPK